MKRSRRVCALRFSIVKWGSSEKGGMEYEKETDRTGHGCRAALHSAQRLQVHAGRNGGGRHHVQRPGDPHHRPDRGSRRAPRKSAERALEQQTGLRRHDDLETPECHRHRQREGQIRSAETAAFPERHQRKSGRAQGHRLHLVPRPAERRHTGRRRQSGGLRDERHAGHAGKRCLGCL